MICITGGVSVGPHDHVKGALAEIGFEQHVWGVSLKPGKPFWFGTRGDQYAHARRQGADGRGDREESQANRVHAPAPEAVAKRGAGDQQHGEGKVVGVDGPFELVELGAEIEPDRVQR